MTLSDSRQAFRLRVLQEATRSGQRRTRPDDLGALLSKTSEIVESRTDRRIDLTR